MRRRAARFGVAAAPLLALGCASAPPAGAPPTLYEAQQAVEQYVDSGRYDADVAAVVAEARAWLEERAPQAERPAIVLDVDETSLSNWPAYRRNGWARINPGPCDLEHGPCGIRAWQGLARSKALPPTLALARRADELGVAVFFITGRPPQLQEATERNLREQGFPFDGVTLEPAAGRPAGAAAFKAEVRRGIAAAGYTILLTMGDQQSDLDGGYAERGFKLPNPVYFIP